MVQYGANELTIVKTHLKIVKVVDGDGLIVSDLSNRNDEEVRFLGVDAPEIKKCRKLLQDERETHLPGQLLMELGRKSLNKLIELAPVGSHVTLVLLSKYQMDIYRRTLAYVHLENGLCLNEMMLSEGYAKPYNRFYCVKQQFYQSLSNSAKRQKIGLFALVDTF